MSTEYDDDVAMYRKEMKSIRHRKALIFILLLGVAGYYSVQYAIVGGIATAIYVLLEILEELKKTNRPKL